MAALHYTLGRGKFEVEAPQLSGAPITSVDATGCHVPALQEVLDYFAQQFKFIYGSDIYLGSDTQDGQLLGLFSYAVHLLNNSVEAAYNSFSPQSAQGVGLERVVKINGLRKKIATYSTATLILEGVVGTVIRDGVVQDSEQNNWLLPSPITIPPDGQIAVLAVAENIGAINMAAGTITQFDQSVATGWQRAYNPDPSVPGVAVEADGALRLRQAISTMLPSQTLVDGLEGALRQLPGVLNARVFENAESTPDSLYGLPGNCVAPVVYGGDDTAIAQTVLVKKGPGAQTYGLTDLSVPDAYGVPRPVHITRPTLVPITWELVVRPLRGYSDDVETAIANALVAYVQAIPIGGFVSLGDAYAPAKLDDGASSGTFNIVSLKLSRDAELPGESDIQLAFNELSVCEPAFVTITTAS